MFDMRFYGFGIRKPDRVVCGYRLVHTRMGGSPLPETKVHTHRLRYGCRCTPSQRVFRAVDLRSVFHALPSVHPFLSFVPSKHLSDFLRRSLDFNGLFYPTQNIVSLVSIQNTFHLLEGFLGFLFEYTFTSFVEERTEIPQGGLKVITCVNLVTFTEASRMYVTIWNRHAHS